MKIALADGMYDNSIRDINHQVCLNYFPAPAEMGGKGDMNVFVLRPTPGLSELVDTSGSVVRGLINYQDTIYAVVDNTFYELTIDEGAKTATATSRGTLNTSQGYISMDGNPTQIMIVDGSSGYIYTPSTTTFAEITDSDFTGGTSVVFMDSYFIYNTPNAATMYATAINDGTSVDALDVTTAEGRPDNLVAVTTYRNELWAFGKKSIEIWYNAANATGFPFSKRLSTTLDIGCSAAGSVVPIDSNQIMWLDHRGFVILSQGYNAQIVSTFAISQAIDSYEVTSDAIAFSYTQHGHIFYVLTFPTENATWVYDVLLNKWHQWSSVLPNDADGRHKSNCYAQLNSLEIVGDYSSGKIFYIDNAAYQDGSDTIKRKRILGHNHLEATYIGVDALELHMETGKGLVTGQGSDPKIMMRYSWDGGYTWSNELTRSVGKIGEYDKRVRWDALGTGREWLFEITYSEPTPCTLLDVSVEVNGGQNG